MSRLTIDLTDEQHKTLKAIAALEGKSMREYSIEKLFPAKSGTELSNENQAWEEFKLFIGKRVDDALAGEVSNRTIDEIFDEVLSRDKAA
jgi:molybdopterin-guanine dinucleotide biosynthesis protein A